MQELFPSYYHKFRCIADRCKHSCCVGWEIDIDEDTLSIYNSLDGEMGDRIRKNISGETPHFVLKDNKCPFLNNNGLCDIISEFGEDGLCDICYLHPRFQNEYGSFIETGLGLCCEEAARIVLSEADKVFVETADCLTKDEEIFFDERNKVFSILQDRSKDIEDRFKILADIYDFTFDFDIQEVIDAYISLERLDEKWTYELESLKTYKVDEIIPEKYEVYMEQLAVYLIFRHFKGTNAKKEIYFVLISCFLVGKIWQKYYKDGFEKIVDIARMYSGEVEYCTQNIERIMNGI